MKLFKMYTSKGPPVFNDDKNRSCFDYINEFLILLGKQEQQMGFYSYYNNFYS